MSKDADIRILEQLCQLLERLEPQVYCPESSTWEAMSAVNPFLDHINHDAVVENDKDRSLIREDPKNRGNA